MVRAVHVKHLIKYLQLTFIKLAVALTKQFAVEGLI